MSGFNVRFHSRKRLNQTEGLRQQGIDNGKAILNQ